ncbi:pneumococcal-type histidine triad protein [Delftia lacustris]|uniref:pneumococcal-type histidine triad protein n=1 Tax=Delftia lacustris TaxID=558537 RepID=UPI001FCB8AF4|nr:pneumococcal-type histidine triad protein [Delftia lacustris]BDE74094.1 hypothetical protein HQS1_52180 [Delftia lacustris]
MHEIKLNVATIPDHPTLLTSFTGDGPVMALDLATVPREVLERITARALCVDAAWEGATITTEYLGAKAALECLSFAANELDQHYHPVVPRARDLASHGIAFKAEGQNYPVIRGGEVVWVAKADLSPLELAAVRSWLQFNMASATEKSVTFQLRLEQFEREAA